MGWIISYITLTILLFVWFSESWDDFGEGVVKFVEAMITAGIALGFFALLVNVPEPEKSKKKVEEIHEKDWDCGARVEGQCVVLYRKKRNE